MSQLLDMETQNHIQTDVAPPEWLLDRIAAGTAGWNTNIQRWGKNVILVRVCHNCQSLSEDCLCSARAEDVVPVWREGQGLNTRLAKYLAKKKDIHTKERASDGFEPRTADVMRARMNVWNVPAPPKTNPSNFLDRASGMTRRGVPVVPLRPNTKIAFFDGWQNLATTDESTIGMWAKTYPTANCGCVARAEVGGIWLWEVDSKEALDRFLTETGQAEPVTLKVRSREQRYHFYFRHNTYSLSRLENLPQGFVKGGDFSVRVDRQYCVSPLSLHPITGEPYQIVNDLPIAEATAETIDWLLAQRIPKKTDKNEKPIGWMDEPMIEGEIHDRMVAVAGRLRDAGLGEDDIYAVLRHKGDTQCFSRGGEEFIADDDKLRQIARSAAKWKTGEEKRRESLVTCGGKQSTAPTATRPDAALTVEQYKSMVDVTNLKDPQSDEDDAEKSIPPFDPSVITGIYKTIVEVVTKGTTMSPQFTYGIAKTIVGIRMAGNVSFDHVDAEPRRYFAAIGITGSGKGYAWERMLSILQPEGSLDKCYLKIVNSADSGAGLKDLFFEHPENAPVVCYIDEMESLGNKSKEGKNPDILDTMMELANSTTVSRVLAKQGKKGGTKTKTNARLAMIMCGQDGFVYAKACSGRGKLGIFDRLTPEYAEPVEAGDTPPVDAIEAMKTLDAINKLPYYAGSNGKGRVQMTMAKEAKDRLTSFWDEQPKTVKAKARFRKDLFLDAYLTAFGESRLTVELPHAEIAIKNHTREMIIRRACFGTQVSDRVSYYIARCKETTGTMSSQLVSGMDAKFVALSERDFARKTEAHRNNELHIFANAWSHYSRSYLVKVAVPKSNGHLYTKYLPAPWD